jgi:WD40 repeat protein
LDSKFVLATGGNDDYVKLWTVVVGLTTKICLRKKLIKEHDGSVMCVRFSKDGQFLASCGGDKLVCIYNVVRFQSPPLIGWVGGEGLGTFNPHPEIWGITKENRHSIITTGSFDWI